MTFRLVTKLHNEEEEVQVASLKYCMGPESEEIMKTFTLSSSEENQHLGFSYVEGSFLQKYQYKQCVFLSSHV